MRKARTLMAMNYTLAAISRMSPMLEDWSVEIIDDEPKPSPRHSGAREAARRLRQMAKRAA